jgi:putative oxidoreductase
MIKESTLNIPKVPAPFATFLLRIPLAVMFLQQGLSKFPVNEVTAEAFGLPFIVWWFVAYGEVGSAIGLIVGGVFGILFTKGLLSELADLLTRFSGITMTCVVTGVIWIMMPDSLIDVITRDYLHVSLYVGGLYFALRGNAKYGL